jgi:nitronate monooxygenase
MIRRVTLRPLGELLGIEGPVIQAPMAGSNGSALVVAVCEAGGLGSLPCASLTPDQVRSEVAAVRAGTDGPFNLNFFCHADVPPSPAEGERWFDRLGEYYDELGLDRPTVLSAGRAPFDEQWCELVEELRPPVVSFHFGLPDAALVERIRATGARVLSSATTAAEARWLVEHGCDAVIAQGLEAGGHRGMFLADSPAAQVGTLALVPQVVDAVDVPVIAAGGIADDRGVAAALALGAEAVQVGTAFLRTPEATTSDLHRAALAQARDEDTVLTNVVTGRPARGIVNRLVREVGPLSADAPAFPYATAGSGPLRAAAEAQGSADFSPLWAGQAVALAREEPAAEVVRRLVGPVSPVSPVSRPGAPA